MLPAAGAIKPEIAFKVVVLPAPLAPISTTSSARRTAIESPRTAAIAPYRHCSPSSCSTSSPLSKVSANDFGVRLDLARRAVSDDAPVIEADDPIRCAHD